MMQSIARAIKYRSGKFSDKKGADVAGFEPAITDLEGRCLIQARPHAQRE